VAHPPDRLGPSEPDRRTEQWRAARIEHFKERQRKTREWINFEEIADWYSREDGSIVPDENKRVAAFDLLTRDFLAGEFEENGRSRVLFLDPAIPRGWREREWFKNAFDLRTDYRQYYLAACWIPRRLFRRWLARYHLPESPPRFEPVSEQPRPVSLRKPKRVGTGAKTRGVSKAIDQVFPDGIIPEGLSGKDRNSRIREQMNRDRSSIPKDLPRAVQRELQKRRSQ
jgi:hypothetical protein